jgi:hypothetical protein
MQEDEDAEGKMWLPNSSPDVLLQAEMPRNVFCQLFWIWIPQLGSSWSLRGRNIFYAARGALVKCEAGNMISVHWFLGTLPPLDCSIAASMDVYMNSRGSRLHRSLTYTTTVFHCLGPRCNNHGTTRAHHLCCHMRLAIFLLYLQNTLSVTVVSSEWLTLVWSSIIHSINNHTYISHITLNFSTWSRAQNELNVKSKSHNKTGDINYGCQIRRLAIGLVMVLSCASHIVAKPLNLCAIVVEFLLCW